MAEDGGEVVPIDGTLDLHTFHPRDVKKVVSAYLDACREENVLQVRIIHGKGTGTLRRIVHALLDARDDVAHYELGGAQGGQWGATVVDLLPLPSS